MDIANKLTKIMLSRLLNKETYIFSWAIALVFIFTTAACNTGGKGPVTNNSVGTEKKTNTTPPTDQSSSSTGATLGETTPITATPLKNDPAVTTGQSTGAKNSSYIMRNLIKDPKEILAKIKGKAWYFNCRDLSPKTANTSEKDILYIDDKSSSIYMYTVRFYGSRNCQEKTDKVRARIPPPSVSTFSFTYEAGDNERNNSLAIDFVDPEQSIENPLNVLLVHAVQNHGPLKGKLLFEISENDTGVRLHMRFANGENSAWLDFINSRMTKQGDVIDKLDQYTSSNDIESHDYYTKRLVLTQCTKEDYALIGKAYQ